MAFLEKLLACGIATATIDLEGHGYSEGLRCHVESIDAFVDDVEQFVGHVTSGAARVCSLVDGVERIHHGEGGWAAGQTRGHRSDLATAGSGCIGGYGRAWP